MADAMRAWRGFPKFTQAVSIALIEASPLLTELQREVLAGTPVPVRWYSDLGAVPGAPLVVIANEFVDALPIRQFVCRATEWRERVVTDDGKGGFAFADGAPATNVDAASAPEGAIRETRPAVEPFLRELACRAQQAPLAALILDYGYEEPGFGDTLQAVRGHRFADPLVAPGEADLSAHVDFANLKVRAGALGLKSYGPMPQGEFLLKLGLAERRERLMQAANPEQKEAIASGALRLADPAQMGVLFKALALTSVALPPPAPFV
jgi:NADH dehydrogenase [ubiquinone] 1 alpha subcomplex assembly factor 7